MKKMITLLLFLLICARSFAPEYRAVPINKDKEINIYDRLIKAVVAIESSGNTLAYNVKEQAVGAFQIRQCRINHYNKLNGTSYTLEDCFDYELSRRIFLCFTKGRSLEQVAKSWNGSGPMTIVYWNKVKKNL